MVPIPYNLSIIHTELIFLRAATACTSPAMPTVPRVPAARVARVACAAPAASTARACRARRTLTVAAAVGLIFGRAAAGGQLCDRGRDLLVPREEVPLSCDVLVGRLVGVPTACPKGTKVRPRGAAGPSPGQPASAAGCLSPTQAYARHDVDI